MFAAYEYFMRAAHISRVPIRGLGEKILAATAAEMGDELFGGAVGRADEVGHLLIAAEKELPKEGATQRPDAAE